MYVSVRELCETAGGKLCLGLDIPVGRVFYIRLEVRFTEHLPDTRGAHSRPGEQIQD